MKKEVNKRTGDMYDRWECYNELKKLGVIKMTIIEKDPGETWTSERGYFFEMGGEKWSGDLIDILASVKRHIKLVQLGI